jgi:plasmid maintenance system antidote protein VapI
MDNEINKRLVTLMEKLGYKKSEYAEMLGVSAAVISHIYNDRNKAGLELVQNILVKFPSINERWLLLNEGEMFKEEQAITNLVLKEKIQVLYKKMNLQKSNLNDLITDLEAIKEIIK